MYYSDLFGFATEEMNVETIQQPIGKQGITFFVAVVPKSKNTIYTIQEIRQIMQEFMENRLLSESTIKPYATGKEIMEPLYINKITDTGKCYLINIVFIDNSTAFRYVKNQKKYF